MSRLNRRNFSPKFCPDPAQPALDQPYTVAAAASAMNARKSMMDKLVRQLKEERAGKPLIASSMICKQI